jgi:hypothetical protein
MGQHTIVPVLSKDINYNYMGLNPIHIIGDLTRKNNKY